MWYMISRTRKQLRKGDMYTFSQKGAPLNMLMGANDHHYHISQSPMLLKHTIKKVTTQSDIKLLQGQLCCKVLICFGNDDVKDVFLREAHPKEGEVIHLPNLTPSVRCELAFEICQVLLLPWEKCWLLPPPILWVKMMFHIFGCWLVVVIHHNSLSPKLFDFLPHCIIINTNIWDDVSTG